MNSKLIQQLKTWVRVGFLTGLLGTVSACSQIPNKMSSQIDYAKYSQKEKPLATQLNDKEEYEFVMDLARLELNRKRYERAESLLQKLRKEEVKDIRLYRLLGQVYEARHKTQMALIAWQEANKLTDKTLDDESELARMSLVEGHYSVAETVYQGWLKKSEGAVQVSALNNLGFSSLLQKRYTQAQSYFEQALKKDPLNSKALNNLKLVKTLVD
ncbi:tetratricopeptide repeat protein [Thiomicrorhabdus sp. ZW0627]|uniref:tetratricopeptide repeat protein n=1 Tax=Thiomicrorhabdus sp. ZW0627 TaxID=3039774 RepID=UPI0024369126|nr:tetratricopeptide repeat protein [Thiomicrorhabdus sp. ZW0627]MDG6774904.1 tetratricopeptide repeat protein [Thiomicrorhabdus sp. ZW0627]